MNITVTPMNVPFGYFNGAMVERTDDPGDGYIMVIRDQHDSLHGCQLDGELNRTSAMKSLELASNIDPRLTRWGGRPYMTSRFYGEWDYWRLEFWPLTENGLIDHHDEKWKHTRFMMVEDWPGYTRRRENNWAPFVADDGELHYVHSFAPHRVLWYDVGSRCVRKVAETPTPDIRWPVRNLCEFRLNTNPVRLKDGSFLSTIHAKNYDDNSYFTGFYRFEGKKPHRVLSMAREPFLTPRHCVGPMLRPYAMRAMFPLSMHVNFSNDQLMIVGGSRDAAQVVIKMSLSQALETLKPV